MTRCEATTGSGKRCLNRALSDSDYCRVHEDQVSDGSVVAAALGAFVGHALLPGLGGALLGGASGALARRIYKENQVSKKKVFVSFDFDNDRVLKDFILGQARHADSPFEVVDHSLKEAAPERDWPFVNAGQKPPLYDGEVAVLSSESAYRLRRAGADNLR